MPGAADSSRGPVPDSSRRAGGAPTGQHACIFRLGGSRYALDATCVREALTVSQIVPVPLTPAWMLGLTSLRGTPLPVVDLEALLGLGGSGPRGSAVQALVLEVDGVAVGACVDRVEAVQPFETARREESQSPSEHRAVGGFLEWPGGVVATLLDPAELARRLNEIRFRGREAAATA
jgi:purine-binding chemotaxis protein CheW